MLIIVTFLLAASAAFALQASSPEVRVGASIQFKGRLLYPDGKPASGATVTLTVPDRSDRARATQGDSKEVKTVVSTDVNGSFAIPFDTGTANFCVVEIRSNGFARIQHYWIADRPSDNNQRTDFGVITLIKAGGLDVTVVDKTGKVVTGEWNVQLNCVNPPSWEWAEYSIASASSDPVSGRIHFNNDLPSTSLHLKAHSNLVGWIEGPSVDVNPGETTKATINYEGPDPSKRIVVTVFSRTSPFFNEETKVELLGLPSGTITGRRFGSQSYAFDDVPPGKHHIQIRSPGLLNWDANDATPGQHFDAWLWGPAAIQLAVVDAETRAPIVDYYLHAVYYGGISHYQQFNIRWPSQAIPEGGNYGGFVEGDYTLLVDATDFASAAVLVKVFPKRRAKTLQLNCVEGWSCPEL